METEFDFPLSREEVTLWLLSYTHTEHTSYSRKIAAALWGRDFYIPDEHIYQADDMVCEWVLKLYRVCPDLIKITPIGRDKTYPVLFIYVSDVKVAGLNTTNKYYIDVLRLLRYAEIELSYRPKNTCK